MVLTNQLIYFKPSKPWGRFFSNYVCFSKCPNFKAGLCIYNIWCWFKEFWTPDFQPQALTMNFPTLDFLNPKPITWNVLGLWRASCWVCRTTTLWGSLRREASYKHAGWQCYHIHLISMLRTINNKLLLEKLTTSRTWLLWILLCK